MKLFVLEDEQFRINAFKDWFKKVYPDAETFFADNVTDGSKILLENQPFDILFLDHDLGGYFQIPSEETGYGLCKFIKTNNIKFARAIIHSMHTKAAIKMLHYLGEDIAEIIPVYSLIEGFNTSEYLSSL